MNAAQVVADRLTYRPSAGLELLLDPNECAHMDQRAIDFLISAGVAPIDIARPLAVRASRATFHPTGRYSPNLIAEFVYIIPAFLTGEVIDAVAWCPVSSRTATRFGVAFALGEDEMDSDGAGTTGLPIRVRKSPLGWLQAGRRGMAFVDHPRAAVALSGRSILADDEDHARVLRKLLRLRAPTVLALGQNRKIAA